MCQERSFPTCASESLVLLYSWVPWEVGGKYALCTTLKSCFELGSREVPYAGLYATTKWALRGGLWTFFYFYFFRKLTTDPGVRHHREPSR